ncbi:hypothetical protein EDB84DRAFT_1442501 [Lactarius hengduanensis]|nr:hypothetical protein EDB84DRAFT_1442501 [Lactarius hengduanensis]
MAGVNLSERCVGFRGVAVCLHALIEEASLWGYDSGSAPSSTLENMRVNERDKMRIDSPLAQQLVLLQEELGHSEVACTQKLSQGCLVPVFDGKGLLTADRVLGPMVDVLGGLGHDCRLGGFGSSMGDLGFQASENQGQWQFNGTGNGAITRQNPLAYKGCSMVTGASEVILERNTFYMGLKTVASNRAIEMGGLKGTLDQKNQEIVDRDKQIDLLKAGCDGCQITFLTDLGPMPTPWKRDEHPDTKALVLAHKGESSGDSPDVAKAKPKVGRPSKKDQEDADHKYLYLQGHDGVKISTEKVSKMSVKAQVGLGLSPQQEDGPPSVRQDGVAHLGPTPEFDFLLLCDDATWKLREWTIQNYSSWAGNRGIRPKNTGEKTQKTVNDKDVLDDHPWSG